MLSVKRSVLSPLSYHMEPGNSIPVSVPLLPPAGGFSLESARSPGDGAQEFYLIMI